MPNIEKSLKAALTFLKDRQSFSVGNLTLGTNRFGDVEVTGWSSTSNFINLTKAGCLYELEVIKSAFTELVEKSHGLEEFLQAKNIKFNLSFDDYGKASIAICSEINGIVHWETHIG